VVLEHLAAWQAVQNPPNATWGLSKGIAAFENQHSSSFSRLSSGRQGERRRWIFGSGERFGAHGGDGCGTEPEVRCRAILRVCLQRSRTGKAARAHVLHYPALEKQKTRKRLSHEHAD